MLTPSCMMESDGSFEAPDYILSERTDSVHPEQGDPYSGLLPDKYEAIMADADVAMNDYTGVRVTSPNQDSYLTSLQANYPSRPFRLFDLPPELRDNIYDNALVDATFQLLQNSSAPGHQHNDTPNLPFGNPGTAANGVPRAGEALKAGLQALVRCRASATLMQTCKGVKKEYEARARTSMVLVLKDNDQYAFQPVKIPEQARYVFFTELHLVLFCHECVTHTHIGEQTCQAAGEVLQHQQWIHNLLPQLPNLRFLSVHAYLAHDSFQAGSKEKVACERIVLKKIQELRSLPKLTKLTLCKYEFNAAPDLNGPKVVLQEWGPTEKAETAPMTKTLWDVPATKTETSL